MSVVAYFVDCDCAVGSSMEYAAVGDGGSSCYYFDYLTIVSERADLTSVYCERCCECPEKQSHLNLLKEPMSD